jgi:hypothetical protein
VKPVEQRFVVGTALREIGTGEWVAKGTNNKHLIYLLVVMNKLIGGG